MYPVKTCNLCENSDFKLFIKRETNDLMKCTKCSLVFLHEFPTDQDLEQWYKSPENQELILDRSPILADDIKERIKIIQKYKKQGKLLDFGTGMSPFLHECKDAGFDVIGVEINESVVNAQKKLGVDVVQLAEIKNNSIDVITLFHVLEHVPNPKETLRELSQKLKKNGIMFVDVPNVDGLSTKLWKENATYVKDVHLFYFSKRTLGRLLENAGLRHILAESKGGFGVEQVANMKEKITGSRHVEGMYKHLKPVVKPMFKLTAKIGLGDSLVVIAQKY